MICAAHVTAGCLDKIAVTGGIRNGWKWLEIIPVAVAAAGAAVAVEVHHAFLDAPVQSIGQVHAFRS